jgi:UDP-N-acetylmuramyl pentapeptide phosphotransferase/UDP-N-acetylglucosamine-1-phosphate transferase
MDVILLSFLTAFTLTYFAIPSIIYVAKEKRIFDEPDNRSSHHVSTPSLGGIAIFGGVLFSIVLWTPFGEFNQLQYILCAFLILFLVGARDDIMPMSANKKMVAQILAACILVFKSDIMLTSLYGLFGVVEDLPYWLSAVISVFTILVIVNAFNLIDGINGLAGCIGSLIASTLGCWFIFVDHFEYAIVAFACVGAIVAFLKYNFTPAKIFMGDTGSLHIGLVCAILVIQFIDMNFHLPEGANFKLGATPVVAIGIMIIPLFDTIRVFVTRILRGYSPFHPDRRHIHHLLLDYGCTHMRATGILLFVNVIFISFVFAFHNIIELHLLFCTVLIAATALTYILHNAVVRKKWDSSPLQHQRKPQPKESTV